MSGSKGPESTIYSFNPFGPVYRAPDRQNLTEEVLAFHRSLPQYQPTPIVPLPGLAARLGIRNLLVKDESTRFGLNAFKVLGASYAIHDFLQDKLHLSNRSGLDNAFAAQLSVHLRSIVLTAATDGNHGKAVAWCGAQLGLKVVIYVPKRMTAARIDAIKALDAQVVVVEGTYDDAVRRCAADSESHGWQVISDTSWEGYQDIPRRIMAGYNTLFAEVDGDLDQLQIHNLDFVLVQAGVGGLAGAAADYYHRNYGRNRPKLICVEPLDAACVLNSIKNGNGSIVELDGGQKSVMAGLNCGIPSLFAWPLLKNHFDLFMAIDDLYAIEAMRLLYYPFDEDQRVIAGESGAAGLAGLLALLQDNEMEVARQKLGICEHSTVLLINSEGATDPESFQAVIGE